MDSKDGLFLEITQHRSRIMGVIVAMVRDFDAAEDVFQDTVVEILRSADRFDRSREFLPWAKGIARNVVKRYYRSASRGMSAVDVQNLEYMGGLMEEDPEADVWEEERKALRHCLEKVDARNRRLLALRYERNIKGRRLAGCLNLSEKSVRTILHRVRGALRRCIERRVGRPFAEGLAR
jgi:RNA polymerase sigma-70 factor (ECF subfamily)